MGHLTTGVTVITTRGEDGEVIGMTANAVTSVSLEPPLILICVDKTADCYCCFGEARVFTVNILAEDQEDISRRFATKHASKFDGVGYRKNELGCAVLAEAVAHLDCRVVREIDAGDHTVYLGEVDSGDAEERPPLLFFRGEYRKLSAS